MAATTDNKRVFIGIAAGTIVVLIFIIFVWPTPYFYLTTSLSGDTCPVRVNRITGKAEVLIGVRGWVEAKKR